MESILIFLKDFGYFNAGALVGGICTALLAVLCFAGPLYWQDRKIKELSNGYDEQYELLQKANDELQVTISDLTEKNNKLFAEVDALKAHNFPKI